MKRNKFYSWPNHVVIIIISLASKTYFITILVTIGLLIQYWEIILKAVKKSVSYIWHSILKPILLLFEQYIYVSLLALLLPFIIWLLS
jgi:hypothetical protein